jgi:hypothetical protein
MTIEATSQPVSMLPYALKFTGISILLSLFVVLVTELVSFDVPSSMGIVILVVVASVVVQGFVAKNSRVMSTSERLSFSTLGTIFSFLSSLIFYAGFMKFAGVEISAATLSQVLGTSEIPWTILAAVLAFAFVITWLTLYFSTGWMCRSAMKRLGKTQK